MIQINGIYRHYKGNNYRVLNIAKCSETLKDFVVYECLYPNPTAKVWIRPLEMFDGSIELDGVRIKRFILIEPNTPSPSQL